MSKTENANDSQKMYLKDYKSPAYEILSLSLDFDLFEDATRVKSVMKMKRVSLEPLELDGENIKLISVLLNGEPAQYRIVPHKLIIDKTPDTFELTIETEIDPSANKAFEGLYMSKGLFATQCEAQGFRHITYFLDRPDVMTNYTVSITADEKKFPVLLSNGDLISKEKLSGNRHKAVWKDPFKKPCYLFALVAGDLGVIQDHFVTMSGKKVNLQIFAAHGKQFQCEHAMESLKKAMKWDEVAFGREYDLNTFMIVAIEDFNMGAMENKGLNIFNSSLVFADAKSATDQDYLRIESVVGHEYFHNWTGNRITCRDWFHLSLKEGLTVFRDQEFSSDVQERSTQRIQDVDALRSRQFPEDAGPNAHPVRPDVGAAMDNFYTATIYEKGAEVIRMMKNLVGSKGFRKGMDLYFERHDGQAVTIEEFANAIADANKIDLVHFKQWYHQAGTPHITVHEKYDAKSKTYTLELEQFTPPTPGQPDKKALHIPLLFGLLDSQGQEMKISSPDMSVNSDGHSLLQLKEFKQTFTFKNIAESPVLSLNRQFSSPIVLKWRRTADDLIHLMKYDTDGFNRREAVYELLFQYFDSSILENKMEVSSQLVEAYRYLIHDNSQALSLKAELFSFPSDSLLAQRYDVFQPRKLESARSFLVDTLSTQLRADWKILFDSLSETTGFTPEDFGSRKLKNKALYFWGKTEDAQAQACISERALTAEHMGSRLSALAMLCENDSAFRDEALEKFKNDWTHDSLVINKWFAIQSSSLHPSTFTQVKRLIDHPMFDLTNPNKVYSLIRAFGSNLFRFFDEDAQPFEWYAQQIGKIDKFNPQVAARLCEAYNFVPKAEPHMRTLILKSLEPLKAQDLSKNVRELISKV
jgi:aminopeptidase N